MKPPPEAVRVPRVSGQGVVTPDAVGYPLIGFPWEPWTLTAWMELTPAQAAVYADWLNEAEAGRLAVILAVFEETGAPVGGCGSSRSACWGWAAGSSSGSLWWPRRW